jgi:hypothetical protein
MMGGTYAMENGFDNFETPQYGTYNTMFGQPKTTKDNWGNVGEPAMLRAYGDWMKTVNSNNKSVW